MYKHIGVICVCLFSFVLVFIGLISIDLMSSILYSYLIQFHLILYSISFRFILFYFQFHLFFHFISFNLFYGMWQEG